MGGHALEKYGVVTERKSTSDFLRIKLEVSTKVERELNVKTYVGPFFRNKETHGDLDLLVKIDEEFDNKNIDIKQYIQESFNPTAIYANGSVYSFDYQKFQVDFICVAESNWETSKFYFSYDPLGNGAGKIYHKFGLSLGHDGLKYKFRNFNGRYTKDIVISKDIEKILTFGDFSYSKWLKGFDSVEEIFNYLVSSKYFNVENFKFQNLNHEDRKRNLRRDSYNKLLSWINNNPDVAKKSFDFNRDKTKYIDYIDEYFPEAQFKKKLEHYQELDNENKLIHSKFNGNLVMEWTNSKILGKELSEFMISFKNQIAMYDPDRIRAFDYFIINNDISTIKNYVMLVYNKTYNKEIYGTKQ